MKQHTADSLRIVVFKVSQTDCGKLVSQTDSGNFWMLIMFLSVQVFVKVEFAIKNFGNMNVFRVNLNNFVHRYLVSYPIY